MTKGATVNMAERLFRGVAAVSMAMQFFRGIIWQRLVVKGEIHIDIEEGFVEDFVGIASKFSKQISSGVGGNGAACVNENFVCTHLSASAGKTFYRAGKCVTGHAVIEKGVVDACADGVPVGQLAPSKAVGPKEKFSSNEVPLRAIRVVEGSSRDECARSAWRWVG